MDNKSKIKQAIKRSGEVVFLLKLDFHGYIQRYATKTVKVKQFLELFDGGDCELDEGFNDTTSPAAINDRWGYDSGNPFPYEGNYCRRISFTDEWQGFEKYLSGHLEVGKNYRIRGAIRRRTGADAEVKWYVAFGGSDNYTYSPLSWLGVSTVGYPGYKYRYFWTREEWIWKCTFTSSGSSYYHLGVVSSLPSISGQYLADGFSISEVKPDLKFEEGIMSISDIGVYFSFDNLRYTSSEVIVNLKQLPNKPLQTLETGGNVEFAKGDIYVWANGLNWEDIQTDGKIFSGYFEKINHTKNKYSFKLIEKTKGDSIILPVNTINEVSWPSHRKEPASDQVSGFGQNIIFGRFQKGIPVPCVDTSGFKYHAAVGLIKPTDSDYTSGTYDLYDKDGNIISPASYVFTTELDGQGSPNSIFDFASDPNGAGYIEPFHCSADGIVDSGGVYIEENELIEHPADIIQYVYDNFTQHNIDDIDFRKIKDIKRVVPGVHFSTLINAEISSNDLIDRITSNIICPKTLINGKIGTVNFELQGDPVTELNDYDFKGDEIVFSKLDRNIICNNISMRYTPNFAPKGKDAGRFEREVNYNKTNHILCKLSYGEYGKETEKKIINLGDVQLKYTAYHLADRYLSFFSHLHDLIEDYEVSYDKGMTIDLGSTVLLTSRYGTSIDGNGYIKERFFVYNKIYKPQTISLSLYRTRFNMDYGGSQVSVEYRGGKVFYLGQKVTI